MQAGGRRGGWRLGGRLSFVVNSPPFDLTFYAIHVNTILSADEDDDDDCRLSTGVCVCMRLVVCLCANQVRIVLFVSPHEFQTMAKRQR